MPRLVMSRINAHVSRCTRLQNFSSFQSSSCLLTKYASVSHNLRNYQKMVTLSKVSVTSCGQFYRDYQLGNVNKFSTTNALAKSKDRGKEKKKSRVEHVNFNELSQVVDVEKLTSEYEKAIDRFKDYMMKYLALRSNIGAIENLQVKFEGDEYTLQELVQISRKPKLIVLNVSAFPQTIPTILEALGSNQMNLNPQQEGTTLYIPIPKVTKEHRENLSKTAKTYFIKCRDNIKDVRNKYLKDVKKQEGLPIDLTHRVEGYLDTLCDQYVSKAEKLLDTKQKELLGEAEQ